MLNFKDSILNCKTVEEVRSVATAYLSQVGDSLETFPAIVRTLANYGGTISTAKSLVSKYLEPVFFLSSQDKDGMK
ncbi:MAG: hypothetical protein M0R77_00105 [Gammaproteobacteria bacterium]|nr:hypothetical protein [Acholeplasmataceae bacterium]MCK9528956.1 hypothetical protein [Gammaproteobacteria bacterium]